MKSIVILGGSYAGVHIAHSLLKHTRPSESDLKVILVSKNSHLYWNMASVRGIVPGVIRDDQLFAPLDKVLERYPKENYELIIGTAKHADFGRKTVSVSTAAGDRTLQYDELVLATGARCQHDDIVPWKAGGTYEEVLQLLQRTSERVQLARSIAVAGAGPTGVEVAGELGYEYGKDKEITLLAADKEVLRGDIIAANAVAELKKLHVNIKTQAKVSSVQTLPDGRTELTLGSGEKLTVDLYLPTMGLIPNSDYVDAEYLDAQKNVVIDEFYRVKGAENVWAAGDIVSKPRAGYVITQKQAAGVGKNLDLVLKGKQPVPVKLLPVDILACATGRGRGAGRMNNFKMFSIMVWLAKGRTLALNYMPGYVDGGVA